MLHPCYPCVRCWCFLVFEFLFYFVVLYFFFCVCIRVCGHCAFVGMVLYVFVLRFGIGSNNQHVWENLLFSTGSQNFDVITYRLELVSHHWNVFLLCYTLIYDFEKGYRRSGPKIPSKVI